jgi:hypothetical protein
MPRVVSVDTVAGEATVRYRRSKTATGVTLTLQTTGNLTAAWQTASVLRSSIVEDGGDWEAVQAVVPIPPGGRLFARLHAVMP